MTATATGTVPRGKARGRITLSWVLWRLVALLALAGIGTGSWAWWQLRHWKPDAAAYPIQGVEIGVADGAVSWASLRAVGAKFVYLDASEGVSATARDAHFVENLEAARAAGLQVGAVHRYDPCQSAGVQSANFVTTVPRDTALLPPVIDLDTLADHCPSPVSDARVESELMTFINQIETHTGEAAILKVSPRFEAKYHVAAHFDRKLWLTGDRLLPDYAGRPWTLWTANKAYQSEIAPNPLRWVVVRP